MRFQRLRDYIWAVAIGLAMIAVLWAGVLAIVGHNRGQARAETATNAANMARVFAEHVRRTVTMIDLALLDYRDFHRANPDSAPGDGWRDAYLKEGGVFQWAVIDAGGMLFYSNLAPVPAPVDLRDREHFRIHRDSGRDDLFISKPVLGRVSNRWSIQFTRRLSRPDGTFAGVVVLSVPPDYFIANFEAIDSGPRGVTLLAGTDRIVRARFSRQGSDATGLGEALPPVYPFFDPARPVGVTMVTSFLDGIDRHSGWRQVGAFPLVVSVQIADADVLEHVAGVERNLVVVGTLVSIVLMAGALGFGYLFDRRDRAQLRLKRQADELRLVNDEVERLAYVAAHDLQEPLRAITSYSQLVTMTYGAGLDDQGREWLDEVTGASARMKRLLRDIQLYLAEKSLPLPKRPADAEAALRAALARPAEPIRTSGASIDTAPLPMLCADARRLEEIFMVLLGNALQYRSPERALSIRVAARRAEGFDVVDVADNGIGIEAQYRNRIFEVFQRLHSRADHPGTGMGLAIVRKMAQRLGGRVEVASTPGEGSVFSLFLPTQIAEAHDDHTDRPAPRQTAVQHSSGGG